jgi:hypothetical protein
VTSVDVEAYFRAHPCFICTQAASMLKIVDKPEGLAEYAARKAELEARALTWCQHRERDVIRVEMEIGERERKPMARELGSSASSQPARAEQVDSTQHTKKSRAKA